jgi:hypothetical protein
MFKVGVGTAVALFRRAVHINPCGFPEFSVRWMDAVGALTVVTPDKFDARLK